MSSPDSATLLGLPTELRCQIYSYLIPENDRILRLLRSQSLNVDLDLATETAQRQFSSPFWYFFRMPSEDETKDMSRTAPSSCNIDVLLDGTDGGECFENIVTGICRLFRELNKSGLKGFKFRLFSTVYPMTLVTDMTPLNSDPQQLGWIRTPSQQKRYDHDKSLVPTVEPKSLLETCSLLRWEFRDWLSRNCRLGLEHIQYKNRIIHSTLQAKVMFPELRHLQFSFHLTDNLSMLIRNLQALSELKSVRIQLLLDGPEWRIIERWNLHPRNEANSSGHLNELLTYALSKMVQTLDQLEEIIIEPRDSLLARYFGIEKRQRHLNRFVANRFAQKSVKTR